MKASRHGEKFDRCLRCTAVCDASEAGDGRRNGARSSVTAYLWTESLDQERSPWPKRWRQRVAQAWIARSCAMPSYAITRRASTASTIETGLAVRAISAKKSPAHQVDIEGPRPGKGWHLCLHARRSRANHRRKIRRVVSSLIDVTRRPASRLLVAKRETEPSDERSGLTRGLKKEPPKNAAKNCR
jgi:hypothetical protein